MAGTLWTEDAGGGGGRWDRWDRGSDKSLSPGGDILYLAATKQQHFCHSRDGSSLDSYSRPQTRESVESTKKWLEYESFEYESRLDPSLSESRSSAPAPLSLGFRESGLARKASTRSRLSQLTFEDGTGEKLHVGPTDRRGGP